MTSPNPVAIGLMLATSAPLESRRWRDGTLLYGEPPIYLGADGSGVAEAEKSSAARAAAGKPAGRAGINATSRAALTEPPRSAE